MAWISLSLLCTVPGGFIRRFPSSAMTTSVRSITGISGLISPTIARTRSRECDNMEMVTIYRNGQPVEITREQFDKDVEELSNLRKNAEVIAHYRTRGGKYEIIARQYQWEGQTCYDVYHQTSGKPSGSGGGAMNPEQFAQYLGRDIYYGRRAGTNYQPVIAHAGVEELLAKAEKEQG